VEERRFRLSKILMRKFWPGGGDKIVRGDVYLAVRWAHETVIGRIFKGNREKRGRGD
jgi:hypothetical protein